MFRSKCPCSGLGIQIQKDQIQFVVAHRKVPLEVQVVSLHHWLECAAVAWSSNTVFVFESN